MKLGPDSETLSAVESSAFVRVGKVKDAHGIKGELYLLLFSGEAAWLEAFQAGKRSLHLLHEATGERKSLAVKSLRFHKNGLIAKTEDLTDRNAAEALIGWLFEIPQDLLVSAPGEAIYLREISGFKVITKALGEVGEIVGFGSNTAQDLLLVRTKTGDFEIPFVEAFVEKIDYPAKMIFLDLPEGLLGESEGDEPQ